MKIYENENMKMVSSEKYNYMFRKSDGYFLRWGETKLDDPNFSPFGPEIADIEITTSCKGPGKKLCSFCYKSNTPNGKNMSLDEFKLLLDKLPKTINQVAFGADAQCESNPDIWGMMAYCREKGVIPNITVADISDETADNLMKYVGAVAVSRYDDKNYCYNSVKKLTSRGLQQTNIHIMISEETYDTTIETINDYKTDERLKNLNAIVFLSLKKKGRGTKHTPLSKEKFKSLVDLALDNNVPIGFDSCSANKFLEAVKDRKNYKMLEACTEPCESTCFSAYFDVDSFYYPCSFSPGSDEWLSGIKITEKIDFIKDVWNNNKTVNFRKNLLKNNRNCPCYDI